MQLDIITPEKIIFSDTVSVVSIPGTLGDFGVLEGHAPFISTLRPGVIMVEGASGRQKLAVMSGIAEVVPERCVILADMLVDCSTLTVQMVDQKLEQANDETEAATTESAKKLAETKRQFVEILRQNLS